MGLSFYGISLYTMDKKGIEEKLFDAVNKNNSITVPILLAQLAQKNINLRCRNDYGATLLICASEKGHTEIVRLLIKAGAQVNECHDNWWTPLMHAVSATQVETVRILLTSGADVNAKNLHGQTALDLAIKWSSKEMEDLLKKYDAKPSGTCIIL